MSFFRKKTVAVAVLFLAVIAAVIIGQVRRLPDRVSGNVVADGEFVCVDDRAGLLSRDTVQYITEMNESLFYQSGAMVFVGTVRSTGRTDILDYADDLGNQYGVGSRERNNGVVILLATENVLSDGLVGDYAVSLGTGLSRYSDELEDLVFEMEDDFAAGRYDRAVRVAFDEYIDWFEDFYSIRVQAGYVPSGPSYTPAGPQSQSTGGVMATLIVLLVIIILLWVIFDGIRYRRYRRRYRGYAVPPVIYRPVFWGRPRRRRPPPPPPPHYGGGPRPPVSQPRPPQSSPISFHIGGSFGGGGASRSGSSRPSGGSKSSSGGFSRGGSFGSSSRSSSRSSSSRSSHSSSRSSSSRGGGASRGGRR